MSATIPQGTEGSVRDVVEICLLWFFGTLCIAARVWCRTKLIGVKGWDIDDWLVLMVAGMWLMAPFIGSFYIMVAKARHTSELSYEQRKAMPASEYHHWEYGSQMFLFGLVGYFFIIWTLKFNMLCFYRRVVRGLWTEQLVKPAMGLVLGSAVVIILTLALTCRPFQALWQVWPDPGEHCVPQNLVFFVTILSLNLLTDLCIMLIPAPILVGIRGSIWRRLGIYFCFTMGAFCMFAAILRFVLIFKLHLATDAAMWSTREDFVGIVVGQAPLLTPLFRRKFWVQTGYASDKSGAGGGRGGVSYDPSGHAQSHELSSGATTHSHNRRKARDPYSITALDAGESEERIVAPVNTLTTTTTTSDTDAGQPRPTTEGPPSLSSSRSRRSQGVGAGAAAKPESVLGPEGIMVERRFDIESAAATPETRPDPTGGTWNSQYPRGYRPGR